MIKLSCMRPGAIAVLLLALGGCYADPYKNPNDWSMTGATRENIAVQVADPSDLISGKSSAYANGVAASAGIDKAIGGAAGTGAGLLTAPPQSSLNITGG